MLVDPLHGAPADGRSPRAHIVVWIFLFGIYRYLIPLEMLSGVVFIAAIARLPLKAGSRLAIMVVLLGGAQIVAWKGDEPRFSWARALCRRDCAAYRLSGRIR